MRKIICNITHIPKNWTTAPYKNFQPTILYLHNRTPIKIRLAYKYRTLAPLRPQHIFLTDKTLRQSYKHVVNVSRAPSKLTITISRWQLQPYRWAKPAIKTDVRSPSTFAKIEKQIVHCWRSTIERWVRNRAADRHFGLLSIVPHKGRRRIVISIYGGLNFLNVDVLGVVVVGFSGRVRCLVLMVLGAWMDVGDWRVGFFVEVCSMGKIIWEYQWMIWMSGLWGFCIGVGYEHIKPRFLLVWMRSDVETVYIFSIELSSVRKYKFLAQNYNIWINEKSI